MSTDTVVARIVSLARDIAGVRAPANAGPDTLLIDGGFRLDSVALLELVVACEQEFAVVLNPAVDVTRETVRSARSLAAVVHAKRG